LSIYQTKYCETTFLAFPAYRLHNIQSTSSGQNKIIMPDVTSNFDPISCGPFRVNSQEVIRSLSPILLKLSLPHVMNTC